KVFRKCRVLSFAINLPGSGFNLRKAEVFGVLYIQKKRLETEVAEIRKQKSVERTEFSWRRRPVHGRPVHGVGDYRFTHGRHLLSRVASTGNP
ncbi:hypothetical protein HID58_080191, partial [Brassica napus]